VYVPNGKVGQRLLTAEEYVEPVVELILRRRRRRLMPNETHDWDAVQERMRKLADEDFPPSWTPEQPDDEIVGFLRRVTMQAPTSFGPAPVVELETVTGGRYSVWLFHKVLRQAFERERVRLGELVLIRYLGPKRPEGGGNSYENYRLVVDRARDTSEPDWAGMAERYGDDAGGARRRAGDSDPGFAGAEDDDIPF
jgi:hypothetical protein